MSKEEILSRLKELEYIRVGSPVKKFFTRKVVGWNVYSSSLLRKEYTIYRLMTDITEMRLPLIIVDDYFGCSNTFKIFIDE